LLTEQARAGSVFSPDLPLGAKWVFLSGIRFPGFWR
jgi:hypothetical protein